METRAIAITTVKNFTICEGQIRCVRVSYRKGQSSYYDKILFCINDVELLMGYRQHGWNWFRDYKGVRAERAIRVFGGKYSDAGHLLLGLESVFLKHKTRKALDKPAIDKIKQDLRPISENELKNEAISLLETKQLLLEQCITSKNHRITWRAKQTNANQMSEFIKTVHPGNETARSFNNVFDSAKEITRYGELTKEGEQLINEMSEIRVQIASLTEKLKDKEIAFNQNQKEILEMKQSLPNNPLLKKLMETFNQQEDLSELKRKLECTEAEKKALESENKELKSDKKELLDRVGEGENFKTAAMFPNKKRYFIGDTKEVNGLIGLVATKRANEENVPLPPKIRSGAERVRTYPTHLLQRIEDDIKTHNKNRYTVLLNPVLKAEYRV